MKTVVLVGALAGSVAALAASPSANAAVVTQFSVANAVDNCQAFTPGPSNTIRNRVTGAENVGSVPIAVACNFATSNNGAASNTKLTEVDLFFTNDSGVAVTISCTMLTGGGTRVTGGPAYAVTKTLDLPNASSSFLRWTAADNPTTGAVDLGNWMVGTNCTLPPGIVLNTTQVVWNADNGI